MFTPQNMVMWLIWLMKLNKSMANKVYDAIAGFSVQLLLSYLTGRNRTRFPDVAEGI